MSSGERPSVRCLAKDPAARPPSARELSGALAALELEELWTEERAREWWSAYESASAVGEAATASVTEAMGDETRSQASEALVPPASR